MKYENIIKATFIERENRFVARCFIENKGEVKVHVKNTGRCKELLIKGVTVLLQHFDSENRKTNYDLISVYKGDLLINMDSQIPNYILKEAIENNLIKNQIFSNITYLKPEQTYLTSRFDFYFEKENQKGYIEVKGVTLEEKGACMFPDAPTLRGIKHINELIKAKEEGFLSAIVFIIQLENAKYFTPNYNMDDSFGNALKKAKEKGVEIYAFDCFVKEDEIILKDEIKVLL